MAALFRPTFCFCGSLRRGRTVLQYLDRNQYTASSTPTAAVESALLTAGPLARRLIHASIPRLVKTHCDSRSVVVARCQTASCKSSRSAAIPSCTDATARKP